MMEEGTGDAKSKGSAQTSKPCLLPTLQLQTSSTVLAQCPSEKGRLPLTARNKNTETGNGVRKGENATCL